MSPRDNKWWTLGAVCTAIFMLLLDITVVNVALPDIQRDLHASFSELQWVVDAYALTLAALLLTAGTIADLYGRRLVFAIGVGLFTVASLGCGLSNSAPMLDIARGVQGIGGAVMFACSLALIAQAFQGRERGTAFGIFGAVTGGAVAVGPLVGGALTEGLGWEWIFFVNIPIGIAAIGVTLTRVAESKDPRAGGIDVPGLVTWSAGLFLLIFALVRGNSEGWGSTIIAGSLAASALLLAAFVVIELRSKEPMLELELLRKPSFTGAAIVAFSLSASLFSMFLYLTLYLQNVLGYSPLEAGVRFLPLSLLSFAVAPLAGKLSSVVPVRLLLGTGMGCVGVGLLLMRGVDASSTWTVLLAGLIVAGIGVGMTNPPLVATQVGVVEPQRSGMASGIGNTFRQVGIATGIAGLGAVFQHEVTQRTLSALGSARGAVPRGVDLGQVLSSGQGGGLSARVPPGARAQFALAIRTGFTGALNEILLIGAIVALIGAVAGYGLVRRRDFVASGQTEAAPTAAA
jgi:EmrB/QacA subfamily drug resistance transporter